MSSPQGRRGRRFRFKGFELWLMGIVAMSTEEIGPLPHPRQEVASPLTMNTRLPILENVSVAFSAETVALFEIDKLSVVKPEFISVFPVVTIEAPPHGLGMMEFDLGVFFLKLSLLAIHFHGGMTVAAGEDPFCQRRWGDRKLFAGTSCEGGKANPSEKQNKKYSCCSSHM